ncbi:MAG: hypothetical protein WD749_02815 [Phycisphaerales bacterium]
MTNLYVFDDANHLYLTGFYLPRTVVFSGPSKAERRFFEPKYSRMPDDIGIAAILTGLARQQVMFLLDPPEEQIAAIGLDTWVLRRSGVGALSSWYAGEQPATRYRVLMHRMPRKHGGRGLPLIWDQSYDVLEATPGFRLERRTPSKTALYDAVGVLETLSWPTEVAWTGSARLYRALATLPVQMRLTRTSISWLWIAAKRSDD